jgi:cytochrome c553
MKHAGLMKKTALIIAVIAAVVLISFFAKNKIQADLASQNEASVRSAVLNSCMECYAVEGVYPKDISYLEKHYGLVIDHSKYIVSYDAFSNNLVPNIKVLWRGQE